MAELPVSDWKGDAFLLVNSYTNPRREDCQTRLEPLIRIDEAIKDFCDTFHTLHFQPVVRWNLTREQLDQELGQWGVKPTSKYVVFYFIGHGGDGDVLFMEDGGTVTTKEIVEIFAQLPKKIYKFFFIDACRGTGPGNDPPYCPALENSLLARSTLPYQEAHTGDTYGIWSKNLLPLLRANKQSLHKTLLVVDAIVKQPTQYTNNGLPDVNWATEVETSGGNLRSSPPPLPDSFNSLSEVMKGLRASAGIQSSGQTLDAPDRSPSKSTVAQKIPSEGPPPTDDKDTTVKPGPAAKEGGSPATITYPTDITEALGNKVDAKWKYFGTYLRFESHVMSTIKANNGECADCMLDLVTKWVKKDEGTGDRPRTWETVVNAVKASDRKQLAIELAGKFGVTITWQ